MPIDLESLTALVTIVVINLILSGDNAVVIGMAAHRLHGPQRRMAILLGGGAAIVLRIALTAVAALLLTLPAVKAIGGLLLLWIGFMLLKQEEEDDQGVKQATTLWSALMTILVADLVMSLDNVLGVAAAANGSIELLIFGLLVSMGLVMVGGGILAALLDRLWWLAYVGSAVIAWTGAELILDDGLVRSVVHLEPSVELLIKVFVTLVVLTAAHLIHRHLPAQRQAAAPAPAE